MVSVSIASAEKGHPRRGVPTVFESEICNLGRLQLKLQLVSDQGDEFGICGLSLCVILSERSESKDPYPKKEDGFFDSAQNDRC